MKVILDKKVPFFVTVRIFEVILMMIICGKQYKLCKPGNTSPVNCKELLVLTVYRDSFECDRTGPCILGKTWTTQQIDQSLVRVNVIPFVSCIRLSRFYFHNYNWSLKQKRTDIRGQCVDEINKIVDMTRCETINFELPLSHLSFIKYHPIQWDRVFIAHFFVLSETLWNADCLSGSWPGEEGQVFFTECVPHGRWSLHVWNLSLLHQLFSTNRNGKKMFLTLIVKIQSDKFTSTLHFKILLI